MNCIAKGSDGRAAIAADVDAVVGIENEHERESVQALMVEELRRLHEGVLARYSLRPSELERWRPLNAS